MFAGFATVSGHELVMQDGIGWRQAELERIAIPVSLVSPNQALSRIALEKTEFSQRIGRPIGNAW